MNYGFSSEQKRQCLSSSSSSTDEIYSESKRVCVEQPQDDLFVSNFEQSLVRMADNGGGRLKRLETAKKVGMGSSEADALAKTDGKITDEKLNEFVLETILNSWHFNARHSPNEITQIVNMKILKNIVLEEVPNQPDVENCHLYLNSEKKVRDRYEKEQINDPQQIVNLVQNRVLSKKHHFTEANDQVSMLDRLTFTRDLLRAMEDMNSIVIYVDVIPFSLSRLENGRLINYEAQVSIAVDALRGIFHSDCLPSSTSSTNSSSMTTTSTGIAFDTQIFKQFLNNLFTSLLDRESEISGKNVFFIGEFPEDFVASVEAMQSLYGVPAYKQLHTMLEKRGGQPYLIKLPPSAPILNLAEFLNRDIRTTTNKIISRMEREEQLRSQVLTSATKEEDSKDFLQKVLAYALSQYYGKPLPSSISIKMTNIVKDIIYDEGFLSFKTIAESVN